MTFEEKQLAIGIRKGDPDAFRALYDRHSAQLLGYLLRLTGSRTEAEDLVQDVFLAAYVGRETFQGNSRLISWLLGIATRRWRDRWRRRAPAPTSLDTMEEVSVATGSGVQQTGMESAIVNTITLTRALARLAPPFREALLLVRSQGLAYAEAATILEEPVGTVKWRVSVATRQVQQILDNIDGEFDEMQQSTGPDQRVCSR